jgi:tetratricopeptide (TPR) repeat protein
VLISPRRATEHIQPHFLLFLGANTRIACASRRRCDPRSGYDDGIVPAVVPSAWEARSAFAHHREEARIAADPVASILTIASAGAELSKHLLKWLCSGTRLAPDRDPMADACCGNCGAEQGEDEKFKVCSGCKKAHYCSPICQKKAWKHGHKQECGKEDKPSAARAPAAAPPPPVASATAAPRGGGAGAGGGEECAICLDALQQPQTLPCGHRFCHGCVASMREHGVAGVQVCPLCRGPMPDAERLYLEACDLSMQHGRWKRGKRGGAPQPPAVQELLRKAAALCREALAIDPEHACARFELGYVLAVGGDADGSLSHLRAAIATDPQHAAAHYNLGVNLGQRGDKAGEEAAYRAAITADAQYGSAHNNMGQCLAGHGDKAGAEAAYRAAIAADPQHAQAHCNLGQLLNERGDTSGAEAAYHAALAAEPQHARSHESLGTLLYIRGDKAGAEAAFRAAIAADPQFALARCKLGIMLDGRGDTAGAEVAYRAAIAADAQCGSARVHLGFLLGGRGDHASAARSFAAALKIDPSDATAKANLQRALQLDAQ